MAPGKEAVHIVMMGIQEGLRGRDMLNLSPELLKAIRPFADQFGEGKLALSLRQNDEVAVGKAMHIIADKKADLQERIAYVKIFGETNQPSSVPILLKIMADRGESVSLRQVALRSLQRYDNEDIGKNVANAYPDAIRADLVLRNEALTLFTRRVGWARQFLKMVEHTKQIHRSDIPDQIVRQLKLLPDDHLLETVDRIWPEVKLATNEEKNIEIERLVKAVASGQGNKGTGGELYDKVCGNCHALHGKGMDIGPDLTGYDRGNLKYLALNIVDPNASVREGYVMFTLETDDGRTLAGIITERSGNTITLKPLNGENIIVPLTKIVKIQAQETSIMPEYLLKSLSEKEIRDLFSYLME